MEGDLFLLTANAGNYRLVMCEVKHSANNCWYAAVESLRQLRLLHSGEVARRIFHSRNPSLSLPPEIPIIGLKLVAPEEYYTPPWTEGWTRCTRQSGYSGNSGDKTGMEAHLAVWDARKKEIRKFS